MSIREIKTYTIEILSLKQIKSKSDIPNYIITLCTVSLFITLWILVIFLAYLALYSVFDFIKQII